VDLASLALGPVYFGDRVVSPPPGAQAWNTSVDLRPARDALVTIDAALDRQTGLLRWTFKTLDPATGQPTEDPDAGFLPPDKTPPVGQGGVSFTVKQKAKLKHNAKISNKATIIFDTNEPIATPTFSNRIDTTRPTSRVRSVKHGRRGGKCRRLHVRWSGKDRGAGVFYFDVYVARNRGRFQLWRFHTRKRKATYRARSRGLYRFRTVASDGAGHVQKNTKRGVKKLKLTC
jgi:hypothetical protein